MAYIASANLRQPRINPYVPDRAEKIGDNTKQATSVDIGKPVKMDGDTVVLCASGDEIYGIVASVEAGSVDGHSYGGVVCDPGRDAVVIDEAGGLTVGALVVAGTAVAFGTAGPGKVIAGAPAVHKWQVIGIENDPSVAGEEVLIQKL